MIRLATVFSGIGAIEHALDRMNIDHKIVFACDNGDVDILTKDIGMNIDGISSEIESLKGIVHELQFNESVEDLYKQQLINMLNEASSEFSVLQSTLSCILTCPIQIENILSAIIEMDDVKAIRKKE